MFSAGNSEKPALYTLLLDRTHTDKALEKMITECQKDTYYLTELYLNCRVS